MQPWKQIGKYGTVGLELVAFMAFGYVVGRWADGKLGTKYITLIGLAFGVVAGFRNLIRAANLMQREADREAAAELRQGAEIAARADARRALEQPDLEIQPDERASDLGPPQVSGSSSSPGVEPSRSGGESPEDLRTTRPERKSLPVNAKGSGNGDAPS